MGHEKTEEGELSDSHVSEQLGKAVSFTQRRAGGEEAFLEKDGGRQCE